MKQPAANWHQPPEKNSQTLSEKSGSKKNQTPSGKLHRSANPKQQTVSGEMPPLAMTADALVIACEQISPAISATLSRKLDGGPIQSGKGLIRQPVISEFNDITISAPTVRKSSQPTKIYAALSRKSE